MRYAVASDIHGSALWCERLLQSVAEEGAQRLVLLGDLMYHGPRNSLPEGYDPAEVARLLNGAGLPVTAVRGNCDSEVDQMLLGFPCMADYALVADGGAQLLCTHGHLDLAQVAGSIPPGTVVLRGHTHVKEDRSEGGVRYLNPGSASIPKDGSHSYLLYEDGKAEFKTLRL